MTLCVWPVTPHPDGDGASQRAWYVLQALAALGPVDLVLLQQTDRPEIAAVPLEPARGVARTVRFVPVRAWATSSVLHPRLPNGLGRLLDLPRIRSVETPRLPRSALRAIAAHLPPTVDTLVVGRLSTACIVDDLCRAGLLRARCRIVDFDDLVSHARLLQVRHEKTRRGMAARSWQRLVAHQMARAERRLVQRWDACTLASDEDTAFLARAFPAARIDYLPNVVERPRLPNPAPHTGPFNLLFVGNLAYPPNADGVEELLNEVLPALHQLGTTVRLTVVGRAPGPALAASLRAADVDLHTDVASVTPFYAAADAVIAPISFGGGTRVKLLEAMALGRPIVATPFAVGGLSVQHGVHALLGQTAAELAAAVQRLARDPALRTRLADAARRLQEERFGGAAMRAAMRRVMAVCNERS